MKREYRHVNYSAEHGDPARPHLSELVSEIPDPEKGRILSYLRVHCVAVSPGKKEDEISPGRSIGSGDIYSDGIYWWDDVFTNYVDRYNIPVPEPFREHILNNFEDRMKAHALLRATDSVKIECLPIPERSYAVYIEKTGRITYQDGKECSEGAVQLIDPKDAEYIFTPVMEELFCYDTDEHGRPCADGYHWKLTFFREGTVIKEIEGWPGEDPWRYGTAVRILKFTERYAGIDLGTVLFGGISERNDKPDE